MLLRVWAFHLKNENYERNFLYDDGCYLKFYDGEDGYCDDFDDDDDDDDDDDYYDDDNDDYYDEILYLNWIR